MAARGGGVRHQAGNKAKKKKAKQISTRHGMALSLRSYQISRGAAHGAPARKAARMRTRVRNASSGFLHSFRYTRSGTRAYLTHILRRRLHACASANNGAARGCARTRLFISTAGASEKINDRGWAG